MSHTRKSYSVEKKLEIITWHNENGASLHCTAKEFGIDRKNLREWIKNETVLRMNDFGTFKKKRKIGSGKKPLSEEMDDELYNFFLNERENGRIVSNQTLSEEAKKIAELDTDFVLISPGCTRLLQPADVCWIKPFKDQMKKNWELFMRKEQMTKKGNLKNPSRQDILNWVSDAWDSVSSDIIEKSFKQCGISCALDGSENGEFHSALSLAFNSPEVTNEEVLDLIFNSDTEDDFEGFSSANEE